MRGSGANRCWRAQSNSGSGSPCASTCRAKGSPLHAPVLARVREVTERDRSDTGLQLRKGGGDPPGPKRLDLLLHLLKRYRVPCADRPAESNRVRRGLRGVPSLVLPSPARTLGNGLATNRYVPPATLVSLHESTQCAYRVPRESAGFIRAVRPLARTGCGDCVLGGTPGMVPGRASGRRSDRRVHAVRLPVDSRPRREQGSPADACGGSEEAAGLLSPNTARRKGNHSPRCYSLLVQLLLQRLQSVLHVRGSDLGLTRASCALLVDRDAQAEEVGLTQPP